MIVYRLTAENYKDDISGHGAELYGGRWNPKGIAALYTAHSISLAVLELVVNFSTTETPLLLDYYLLEVFIPDKTILNYPLEKLPPNWVSNYRYTQEIGNDFLQSNKHLVLKVPSAVIPQENNYIINTHHKAFNEIYISKSKKYNLDNRLKHH